MKNDVEKSKLRSAEKKYRVRLCARYHKEVMKRNGNHAQYFEHTAAQGFTDYQKVVEALRWLGAQQQAGILSDAVTIKEEIAQKPTKDFSEAENLGYAYNKQDKEYREHFADMHRLLQKQDKIKWRKRKGLILIVIAILYLIIRLTMYILDCRFWGAVDYLLHPWEYEKLTKEEVVTTDFGDVIRVVYKCYPSLYGPDLTGSAGKRTEVRFYYKSKRFYTLYDGSRETRICAISNDERGKVYLIVPSGFSYFLLSHDTDTFEQIPHEEIPLFDPSYCNSDVSPSPVPPGRYGLP